MPGKAERYDLTPELLLRAYAAGIFPMAESRGDPSVFWVEPEERGVIPLDAFHLSRSLGKALRRDPFQVRCDTAFEPTIRACAEATEDRPDTWINEPIIAACVRLHGAGFAHSVECWRRGEMVGGVYGVSLGAAFFAESMFSRATDASKVALAHLAARLRQGGYMLLDVQFVSEHLKQFGAVEIPAAEYRRRLVRAVTEKAAFRGDMRSSEVAAILRA